MEKILTTIFLLLFAIFFVPFLCMLAWNRWALGFNLPQFDYWHWVLTVMAIRFAFGRQKLNLNTEE